MTHEPDERPSGATAGPEDDDTLPDATTIPTHDDPADRTRDTDLDD